MARNFAVRSLMIYGAIALCEGRLGGNSSATGKGPLFAQKNNTSEGDIRSTNASLLQNGATRSEASSTSVQGDHSQVNFSVGKAVVFSEEGPTPPEDPDVTFQGTQEVAGEGRWCEVAVPKPDSTMVQRLDAVTSDVVVPVKVLTYNLFWWNLFNVRRGNGRSAGKTIAYSGKDEAFDLMGFQECDDVDRVLKDAVAEGLSDDYQAVRGTHAIAIAFKKSRWELLESGVEDVGEDAPWQYYGRRAAMYVRLREQGTNKTVLFANHHGPLPVNCDSGCSGSATTYNILQLLNHKAMPGDTIILVGDFNAGVDSSRIKAMDYYLYRLFSGSALGGVDHIFSNIDTVKSRANLGHGGSDHEALSLVMNL